MSSTVNEGIGRGRARVSIAMVAGGLALAAAAAIGIAAVFSFVDSERERDLRTWQARLGIVADSRFAAGNDWLDQQFGELIGLAENASLQLYTTELNLAAGDRAKVTEEPVQAAYLRDLLKVTAERSGFTGTPVGPTIDANVRRVGVAGIVLVDLAGRVVVGTPEMPPIEGRLLDFVVGAPRGERALLDIHLGVGGTPTMGFLVPVFAVQGDPVPSQQIGMIVGVKEVAGELYPLLKQPGAVEETAETLLVRGTDAAVEYLSPLLDGTPPLERRLARDTPELAAAYAIETPGGFAVKRDYRNAEVLVTGRAFIAAPWTLVHKIDWTEALAESEARLTRLMTILLLLIALVTAAMLAVWRHGASRRASAAADRFQQLAQRFEHQENFLRLVTDSQPNPIFITDAQGRYRFANRATGRRAGIEAADLIGKKIANVLGPDQARPYERANRQVLDTVEAISRVHRFELDGQTRVVQSEHIPLAATSDMPRSVLVVDQDITQAVAERERRERNLQQLVQTLVTVVDRRDPHAAHHSSRVAIAARATAGEMGIEEVLVETAAIAGSLLNLGKILVPSQLLTKEGQLSEEEMRTVRDSIQTSAELIEGIEFDGPVVETLRQAQERWDGSGVPRGLKGDQILVTARIIAVANAFVAIVSPRAHRPGVDFDAAVESLLKQIGSAFDRAVVAALIHYMDNRGGRERWADFVEPVPEA